MYAELAEHARAMVLDRAHRQMQAGRDLRVRMSEREQPRDLDLARREPARREHAVAAPLGFPDSAVRATGPSLGSQRDVFRRAFRDPDLDRGAARPALDPAPTTRDLRPLQHGGEPAVSIRGPLRGPDVEPDPVILDDDVEPASLVREPYGDERGLGMPACVGEGLLDDAIQEEPRDRGGLLRQSARDLETRGSAELRPSIEVRAD